MGGEVIIIAQDPDVVTPSPAPNDPSFVRTARPKPKIQLTQVSLKFSDRATSDDIAMAVRRALELGEVFSER